MSSCDAYRDSRNTASSLSLKLTFSGVFVSAITGGVTTTTTYPSTTKTITLTREAFPRVDYYKGTTPEPTDGNFWMLSKCCCWKCRFWLMPVTVYSDPTIFLFPWDQHSSPIDYPASGTTPMSETGTLLPQETRPYFCHNSTETGRKGLPVSFTASCGVVAAIAQSLDWAYTDSMGNSQSGSGYTDGLSFPGPVTLDPPTADTCADSITWWGQLVYTGTDTSDPAITFTTTATIKVQLALS